MSNSRSTEPLSIQRIHRSVLLISTLFYLVLNLHLFFVYDQVNVDYKRENYSYDTYV